MSALDKRKLEAFNKSVIGQVYSVIESNEAFKQYGIQSADGKKIDSICQQNGLNYNDLKLPYLIEKERLGIINDEEKNILMQLQGKFDNNLDFLEHAMLSVKFQMNENLYGEATDYHHNEYDRICGLFPGIREALIEEKMNSMKNRAK